MIYLSAETFYNLYHRRVPRHQDCCKKDWRSSSHCSPLPQQSAFDLRRRMLEDEVRHDNVCRRCRGIFLGLDTKRTDLRTRSKKCPGLQAGTELNEKMLRPMLEKLECIVLLIGDLTCIFSVLMSRAKNSFVAVSSSDRIW